MADYASANTSLATTELIEKPVTHSVESNNALTEQAGNVIETSASKPEVESTGLQDFDVVKSISHELEHVNAIYQMVVEFFVGYSFQIVGALLIMLVGIFVAGKVSKMVERLCLKKKLDVTLSSFMASTIKMIIVVLIGIIALGKLGISVTPFVAAIGALSLGAGLAMQGLLANYAAGLNIIVTRPFIVGDTIEVQKVTGLVKKVQLAYTMLIDEDGTEITIPNRHIVGEIIHNSYSNMLAEISIGIAYSEDAPRAILVIMQALAKIEELQDIKMPLDEEGVPKTEQKLQIGIGSFGASSVNLSVRAWLPTSRFHQLRFRLNAAIYAALNENNVKIPFPQHEVRMLND
jgi:small conductance mechanosensitive channel